VFRRRKKVDDRWNDTLADVGIGGLLPMVPYFAIKDVTTALYVSIGITAFILLAFGYGKAVITGTSHKGAIGSAIQTLIIGAAAAAASYGIVRGIDSTNI
jgi:VIT1/CCC1 family predicted Fe2+/Mn2+ transporter